MNRTARAQSVCILIWLALLAGVSPASEPNDSERTPEQAIERGLLFLVGDARQWRNEHECATCHHGTMTVWALCEAQQAGYAVDGEPLAEMTSWTKERWLKDLDKPRDPRPGWNMVKLPAVLLGCISQTSAGKNLLQPAETAAIADHIVRHQEAEGFWAIPESNNAYPPVFESAEVYTLWACLALRSESADASPAVQQCFEQAHAFLGQKPAGDDTQACVLRLLLAARQGASKEALQASVDAVLEHRNADGGWGQIPNCPSDAFATGQVLFALSQVDSDRKQISPAISFLVANQRDDGSWPAVPRVRPNGKTASNLVPITYFGSAWATIGLMKATP